MGRSEKLDKALLDAVVLITPKYEEVILSADSGGKIKVPYKSWGWRFAYDILKNRGIVARYKADMSSGCALLPLTELGMKVLEELRS